MTLAVLVPILFLCPARANLVVTSSPGDSLDNSVGTNVSFTCEASGVGLGMRWYRNGEEESPGSRVVISGFTMTIYGLLEGDSGMYQCSVSNGTSSVWRQWKLNVTRKPREYHVMYFHVKTQAYLYVGLDF